METISSWMSDVAVMRELGARLAQVRLERNMTQAALAEHAGVSKRTVERLEKGQTGTQFTAFLRICRSLGLLDRLELLVPAQLPSPIEQLKRQQPRRKRARETGWTWGDEP